MILELEGKKHKINFDETVLYTKNGTEVILKSKLTDTGFWAYEKDKPDSTFMIYLDDIASPKVIELHEEKIEDPFSKTDFKNIQKDMEKAAEMLKDKTLQEQNKQRLKEKHQHRLNRKKEKEQNFEEAVKAKDIALAKKLIVLGAEKLLENLFNNS